MQGLIQQEYLNYRNGDLYVYLSKRKCPAPQSPISPLVLLLGTVKMTPKE